MEDIRLWGAIVNALAVIAGGLLGTLLLKLSGVGSEKGLERKEKLNDALMKGMGLCVLLVGIQGAIKSQKVLVVITSIAVGALVGTLLDLDGLVRRLGDKIDAKFSSGEGKRSLSEGFISASLLFCIGAMAITGPLESGLSGNHATQYAKALIDGISAVVMASSLGGGVMLSAIPVFLYQGSITLLASLAQPLLTAEVINEISATGSLLIVGISLNMLGLTKLKLMNYVPAVFLPLLFCLIF